MTVTHQTAKTQYVDAGELRYAYRRFGNTSTTTVPLLFLIHFRGTMDFWDPLLVNSIAAHREVILFDNAGVGQSTGTVPPTVKEMAQHVIRFLELIHVKELDVLGFSMGGFIAPLVHLDGPQGLVRKLVIAGSGPSAGEGVLRHSDEQNAEVGRLAGQPTPAFDDGLDKLFFAPTPTSQAAGQAFWRRMQERNKATSGEDRSNFVSWGYADGGAGVTAMVAALGAWGNPENRADGDYDRLAHISVPTFVGQGSNDFMIPTVNSFVMEQKIPNARLKIFPDSGHGFLYQYAEEFAGDVNKFLDSA